MGEVCRREKFFDLGLIGGRIRDDKEDGGGLRECTFAAFSANGFGFGAIFPELKTRAGVAIFTARLMAADRPEDWPQIGRHPTGTECGRSADPVGTIEMRAR